MFIWQVHLTFGHTGPPSGAKQKGTVHNPGSGSIMIIEYYRYSYDIIDESNLFVQFKDVGLVGTQAVMIGKNNSPMTSGHRTVEIRVDLLPPSVTDLLFVLRQREIAAGSVFFTSVGNSLTWSKVSSRDANSTQGNHGRAIRKMHRFFRLKAS